MSSTDVKMRITVFGLVFVLSVLFFWLAINQYLLPSSAQLGSNMQVIPHSTSVECNPVGECYVHVLASTDVQNQVAGLSGQIRYSDFLEPVRLDKKGVCVQSVSYTHLDVYKRQAMDREQAIHGDRVGAGGGELGA